VIPDTLVPERFELVEGPDTVLAIRRDASPHLRRLAMARARDRDPGDPAFHGRGSTQRFTYDPESRSRAVIRRYRRGGFFRWLTRDKLFCAARPFRELRVVESARADGVPTVEVLAVRVDRVGPFLYEGEMVTRELEDAPDLVHWLRSPPPPEVRRSMIQALARAVARLHRAGVLHSDLHLKNLLVRQGKPPQAYVIDLDKAIRRPAGALCRDDVLSNLKRLDRSVEKFNYLDLGGISKQDRLRFLDAYLEASKLDLGRREILRSFSPCGYRLRRLRWSVWRWWRGGAASR